MIDIHSHILPGLDDGAGSVEESLAMARRAAADGIRMMVATPHVITGLYPNGRETILSAVEQLQRVFEDNGIDLPILPGAEYRLEPDLPKRMARGELLTVNDGGRYLLVEMPAALVPDYTGQVFYELQLQGLTPIIAHPERNEGFARDHGLLHELVSHGALVQITAGSLTGLLGSAAAANARAFLRQGCVHFIATDAHASSDRAPVLSTASREAARLAGEEEGISLVTGNPRRAIRGERIETGEIKDLRPAGRGIFSFFRKYLPK
ncbi:Tyrosine-protein phosphatase YwqE [Pelotomaculum schinkii]|uniref:protein-tyrosine-phosphatase n=1 Tax=Pelotomaculum schinkii TaxID=78350 RepID=A0A4Y7RHF8_9FIRM|nr:CpsB/CapC family capsule biosynthesis tyrosine phosphatase [Pelotomaculum schinkii]TEB08231.1 Tyrosine-protein phosphatase YwqE [Pelotomaculum schinkii]